MGEVRLRARKARSTRVREIQGMLAMQGLLSEAGQDSEAVSERSAAGPFVSGGRTADVRPLPYRLVLATWPIDWRERWGRRANDLEDSGLGWRDAEGRAFVEVYGQFRASTGVERN